MRSRTCGIGLDRGRCSPVLPGHQVALPYRWVACAVQPYNPMGFGTHISKFCIDHNRLTLVLSTPS